MTTILYCSNRNNNDNNNYQLFMMKNSYNKYAISIIHDEK